MALISYKEGQGRYTRLLSAVGAGVLALAGAGWAWAELSVVPFYARYIQAGVAVFIIGGSAGLLWWLLNKPDIADFMIATEAEMRKVNWPTRHEIIGSTYVVIWGTVLMALLLWIVDLCFSALFIEIGILQTRL